MLREGGELHLGNSSPSEMNTNIQCRDPHPPPPSCSTHSACWTLLAAIVRAQRRQQVDQNVLLHWEMRPMSWREAAGTGAGGFNRDRAGAFFRVCLWMHG